MSDKLIDVHPRLVAITLSIQRAMAALGFPMMVTDGVRTAAQQATLYAKGRTEPGAIVTYNDGIVKKSNHQKKADGYGHAVDLTFLVDGKPSWAEAHPWRLYGAMVRAMGCRWGGDFTTFSDKPHMEFPE